MTGWRAIWEVARREVVERSRSRVMRVSLALLLVLSAGGAIASARLSGRTSTDDIGLVGARSAAVEPAIRMQARATGHRVHVRQLASEQAAERAVRNGELDVALLDGGRLFVKRTRSQSAVTLVQDSVAAFGVFERLQAAGLTREQALAALTPQSLRVDVLDPGAARAQRNRGVLFVGLLVLYLVLLGYGSAVSSGVTEEKSSRVVELLLTTVSPRRLLTGKVLGIGVLGLAQLLLVGASALVAGRLAGGAGLPSAAPQTFALVVLWFVLGYALYSVAYAAVGALVSRQEDLQTAAAPLTVLVVGSFLLVSIVQDDPNGTLARVTAFLPPFAPMLVPARVVLGDMTTLAVIAAVAVDLLATAALMLLAARIYEGAILRIGAPVKLRQVLGHGAQGLTARPADSAARRHPPAVDAALRWAAAAIILAGVLALNGGVSKALAIALIALGLLLLAVRQARRRPPRGLPR